MRLLVAVLLVGACARTSESQILPFPRDTLPASASARSLSLPESWLSEQKSLVDASRVCDLDTLEERWEHRGSQCMHTRSFGCLAEHSFSSAIRDACNTAAYGPIKAERFKLDTKYSCASRDGEIHTDWPFKMITFSVLAPTPCEGVEPAWVASDVERVHPIVGDAQPAASHWTREAEGADAIDSSEVEWSAAGIDEEALARTMGALRYDLVTHQTDYTMWSTRKPDEYSFTLTKNGYREDRLIVSRWVRKSR